MPGSPTPPSSAPPVSDDRDDSPVDRLDAPSPNDGRNRLEAGIEARRLARPPARSVRALAMTRLPSPQPIPRRPALP